MIIKPMLAATVENPQALRFPLLATPKIDGIRAFTRQGVLYSRTGKLIPNKFIRDTLRELPSGFDGELIVGNTFQETSSGVMSLNGTPHFTYWVFDWFSREPYDLRVEKLQWWINSNRTLTNTLGVQLLLPTVVCDLNALLFFEEECLKEGYEGICLRSPQGPYKQGRSTLREGYLLKLKRFTDSEAVVKSMVPWSQNNNPQERNELGYAKRSSCASGKQELPMLGALCVEDVGTGVCFNIGSGFTEEQRRTLWNQNLVGRVCKYKYFSIGVKDKPRHPIFLGWRNHDE